jgi:hypothetical protein
MLTAIAVFALLFTVLFSMTGSATKLTDSTARNGDASIEAMQVLDRIGVDVAGMIIRPDVDQLYVAGLPNPPQADDAMYFFTQTPGYSTDTVANQSLVSFVGYRILPPSAASGNLTPVLQRTSKDMSWNDPNNKGLAMPFLVFPFTPYALANTTPFTGAAYVPPPATSGTIPTSSTTQLEVGTAGNNYNDGNSTNWHTVGNQIFRLSICFQLRNGAFTLSPPTPSVPVVSTGTSSTATSIYDTVGMVVAIGVLDTKSQQIVPAASWTKLLSTFRESMATDLAPPTGPPQLMDEIWKSTLGQPAFTQNTGIPQEAALHVQVYQRYYRLNVPQAP